MDRQQMNSKDSQAMVEIDDSNLHRESKRKNKFVWIQRKQRYIHFACYRGMNLLNWLMMMHQYLR